MSFHNWKFSQRSFLSGKRSIYWNCFTCTLSQEFTQILIHRSMNTVSNKSIPQKSSLHPGSTKKRTSRSSSPSMKSSYLRNHSWWYAKRTVPRSREWLKRSWKNTTTEEETGGESASIDNVSLYTVKDIIAIIPTGKVMIEILQRFEKLLKWIVYISSILEMD